MEQSAESGIIRSLQVFSQRGMLKKSLILHPVSSTSQLLQEAFNGLLQLFMISFSIAEFLPQLPLQCALTDCDSVGLVADEPLTHLVVAHQALKGRLASLESLRRAAAKVSAPAQLLPYVALVGNLLCHSAVLLVSDSCLMSVALMF